MARHIYVHNPFCARKCPYCDFYSITDHSCIEEFYKAAIKETELIGSVITDKTGTNQLTDADGKDTVYSFKRRGNQRLLPRALVAHKL